MIRNFEEKYLLIHNIIISDQSLYCNFKNNSEYSFLLNSISDNCLEDKEDVKSCLVELEINVKMGKIEIVNDLITNIILVISSIVILLILSYFLKRIMSWFQKQKTEGYGQTNMEESELEIGE